jgi:FkbM family methyltransferase
VLKRSGFTVFRSIGKGHFRLKSSEIIKLFTLPKKAVASVRLGEHALKMCNPYWFIQNFNEIFEDEVYLFRCEKASPFILDCGSNVGLSILFFKHLFPDAQVIGFEPDPFLFKILEQNIAEFELSNVRLENNAVWKDACQSIRFLPDIGLGGRLDEAPDSENAISVNTVRLKDYLTKKIDFLKIDIEGAEIEVVKDIQERLNWVERLFVEYHSEQSKPQELQTLLDILQQSGFRYHVKEANPVLHPFIKSERNSGYDLQLNIYAFRD